MGSDNHGYHHIPLRRTMKYFGAFILSVIVFSFLSTLAVKDEVDYVTTDHDCNPAATHSFNSLSRSQTMLDELASLYSKYGDELATIHETMFTWCNLTQSCKYCDREAEMLYMLVREWKPKRVFEMAPNKGYSTHFILSALEKNEEGRLDSFDIHDNADRHVTDPVLRSYWNFQMEDVTELIKKEPSLMQPYDFIFIDALHTTEFSRWYSKDLLSHSVKCDTPVIIHDIVADKNFEGRESQPVYAYLAFKQDIGPVFNLNTDAGVPTPYDKVAEKDAYKAYEDIRTKNSVGGEQKYFKCNGRDPSIYFLKKGTM